MTTPSGERLPSVPPVVSGQSLTFRWDGENGVMADNVNGRGKWPHLEVARVTSYNETDFSSAWTDEYTNALVYLNVKSTRFRNSDQIVRTFGAGMYDGDRVGAGPKGFTFRVAATGPEGEQQYGIDDSTVPVNESLSFHTLTEAEQRVFFHQGDTYNPNWGGTDLGNIAADRLVPSQNRSRIIQTTWSYWFVDTADTTRMWTYQQ